VNYTYDAAGNVTNDGAHSYTYDAENRLVSVDGGSTAQYGYDHANRRIKKTIGGVTTHCVWEGGQVIAENNASSGAVNVEYVYSGSRMLASIAGGVTRYYLADRLSARVTLDTSGNILGRQAHLPFGEELNATGTTDKHRFTSYERDSETGIDYAVNRMDSTNVGRFLQVDKVAGSGSPQRLNRFAYTRNDPINRVDPLGLDDDCPPGTEKRGDDCVVVLHGEDDYPDEPWEPGPGVQSILNIAWFLDPAESGYGTPESEREPCRFQDLDSLFPISVGRYTQKELREIAQTALGEASVGIVSAQEIGAIIATIINRQSYNIAAAREGRNGPFIGGTAIVGILEAGYDAHRRRSGEAKLRQAKALSGGVLYADDYVCGQLEAIRVSAEIGAAVNPLSVFTVYPLTSFRGRGAHRDVPRNATNIVTYGNTIFWLDPDLPPLS